MPLTKRKNSEKQDLLDFGDAEDSTPSNIKGDELNIAVLLFLYTLQGIPLGLAGAVPMLLQNRGITYTQQAEFSFVNWPFSVKLLWAPIVDAIFWPEFGRRKTWLVPVQYLLGIVMIIMSNSVMDWIGSTEAPNMMALTISFLFLNFLAATQDIAVDGWALTMLKRCNVGHASTCNTVGQTAGFFLGYVLFLALESAHFCNKYLRSVPQEHGIVDLASFLLFWGWMFIITTSLIAIFKHERNVSSDRREDLPKGASDIVNAYKQLYTIVKLPAVRTLTLVLFTAKLGFCASDAVSGLKLVEAGVPREDLALLAIPLVPVQIIMPVILAKHTTGPAPLSLWLRAYPLRLLVGPLAAGLVALTPTLLGGSPPSYTYLFFLMVLYIFHQENKQIVQPDTPQLMSETNSNVPSDSMGNKQIVQPETPQLMSEDNSNVPSVAMEQKQIVQAETPQLVPEKNSNTPLMDTMTCLYCMFVAVMAFFAKVSDPLVGGTYMTLLNTVSNLGTNWPNTLALWAIDHLTYKGCSVPALSDNRCSSQTEIDLCKKENGTCEVRIDGFYIETAVCLVVGFAWLQWGRRTVLRLQRLPASHWQTTHHDR